MNKVVLTVALLVAAVGIYIAERRANNQPPAEKTASLELSASDVHVLPSPISVGQVAFTLKDGKQSDILIIDLGSRIVRPLVATPVDDEFPVWSPDGAQLLFYSDMSGDREIYLVNADGTGLKQLTNSPGIDEDPDWAPDGKRIAFRSERNGGSSIFVMNADGSNVSPLTNTKKTHTMPRWSPKGDALLYSTNTSWPGWDIMMLRIGTEKHEQQTSGIKTFCHAAWNPEGTGFSFSHGGGSRVNLFMKSPGGEEQRLTDYAGKDYDAAWVAPQQLVFVRELTNGKDDYQLFFLDVGTKMATRLTENRGELREPRFTQTAGPTGSTQVIRGKNQSDTFNMPSNS